ncbi:hypothetical protein LINPERHAP2_LOCUS24158 [Linum perenne]
MVTSKNKLQKMVNFAILMIQKGVSKSKLALDLHLIMKRGKDLITHHRQITATCRPDDPDTSFLSPISCGSGHVDVRLSYVSPRDYQFSCTNTPSSSALRRSRRKSRKPYHHNDGGMKYVSRPRYNMHHYATQQYAQYHYSYYKPQQRSHVDATSHADVEVEDTSTVGGCSEYLSSAGGDSRSPLVRQVRITDSPFSSLRGAAAAAAADEVDCHVDVDAERFIQKFYMDLRLQKWMSASSSYHTTHSAIY